jgi:cyclic beta-1,2-glucan synthetase
VEILGDLSSQLERHAPWLYDVHDVERAAELRAPDPESRPIEVPPLAMENGLGGFTHDGREYVVVLEGERETPLPWSNVLANPAFGTIVSCSGSAFTWAGNSRENRLTSFANDPLGDPTTEAFYVRDEDTGAVWGATPAPLPRRADAGDGSFATPPESRDISTLSPGWSRSSPCSWRRTIP